MRWACFVILSATAAGCSDSLPPASRAALPAGKTVPAKANPPAITTTEEASRDTVVAVEEAPDEIASALAKAHPERGKAMLAAAKKALEGTSASYEMGTNTLANFHLWSRNVLLAERALATTKEEELAALVDYWKRSKHTYLKVRALYTTGSRGGEYEQFAAAAYYLAEAELWLEAAGGAVPDDVE